MDILYNASRYEHLLAVYVLQLTKTVVPSTFFGNTLFKYVHNLHEETFCLIVHCVRYL